MLIHTFEARCEYCDEVTYWCDESGTSICATCAATNEFVKEQLGM